MNRLLEQRFAIKFCVKLGKPAIETLGMIRAAYGDDAMRRTSVFKWHKSFRKGREHVEDDGRSGRPSTSETEDNVAKVKALLDSDRRLSVRKIAERVELPKSVVHRIVKRYGRTGGASQSHGSGSTIRYEGTNRIYVLMIF